MQFPDELINQLSPNTLKLVAIVSVGLLWSAAIYFMSKGKQFIQGMDAKMEVIDDKLDKIQSNCLTTIQANTGKAADLLERIAEGQAELNGYLKGKLDDFRS
jgi:hypothetical protein